MPTVRKTRILCIVGTRPEAVDTSVAKLVGPVYERILEETQQLLDDRGAYSETAKGVSPYGDGHAAESIVRVLREGIQTR